MKYDIIEVTDVEMFAYTTKVQNLIRQAQYKKNDMLWELNNNKRTAYFKLLANGVVKGSILDAVYRKLEADYTLKLNMLIAELKGDLEDIARETQVSIPNIPNYSVNVGDGENAPPHFDPEIDEEIVRTYPLYVDYSKTYPQRYEYVRAYYITYGDKTAMIADYRADTVAQEYLGTYYQMLDSSLSQL